MTALVLASASRYKAALLARFGLPFETASPRVDETRAPGEAPSELAERLARHKAEAAARPDALVVGADQVASLDGRVLGKPLTRARALAQLGDCQGREVEFHTAACVLDTQRGRSWRHLDVTTVKFRRLPQAALACYIEREPAYDCAGGFKAEGLGIALFEAIESTDPTALIGLPLIWLAGVLREAGLDPLR